MRKLFFIIFIFFISACSIHTARNYDKTTYLDLAQVGLGTTTGQNPYLIKQSFQEEFYINEQDIDKPKKYTLNLNVASSIGDWLIQSDSTVLRKNLNLSAHFSLRDFNTNKMLTSGAAQSLIIFSESPSAWSSYVSSEKAYKNAVRDSMRLVRIKVAAFLAKHKHTKTNENKSKKHRKISK